MVSARGASATMLALTASSGSMALVTVEFQAQGARHGSSSKSSGCSSAPAAVSRS